METIDAYNKAVEVIVWKIQINEVKDITWLGKAIQVLWERAKQEGIAAQENAFSPGRVISIVNDQTRETIRRMKQNPERFNIMFEGVSND